MERFIPDDEDDLGGLGDAVFVEEVFPFVRNSSSVFHVRTVLTDEDGDVDLRLAQANKRDQ